MMLKQAKSFAGCFRATNFPGRSTGTLVVNTDTSTKPGTHWIGIFLTSPQNGEWFDSYGNPPEFYGAVFTEFMNNHCNEWEWSDRKLQSDWSDVCGHYCIFYVAHRARRYSMKKIVQLFGKDTVLNDSKVF